jgi:hypothetical protein
MGPRQRILAAALAACALVCAFAVVPARTLASTTQQSSLMDDDELEYASPSHVVSRLEQLRALGVDVVKVSMMWYLVAPDPGSHHRPAFDATDPAQYPSGSWDRYDLIAREATALGMRVYFQIIPRVPIWALPPGQPVQGSDLSKAPDPNLYRQFVEAAGRRYSGSFTISETHSYPTPTLLGLPLGPTQQQVITSSTIPRVSEWGIWNEPNEKSWLSPYHRTISHHRTQWLQPLTYRRLVDAGYAGLVATGHGLDTILIGETANNGILDPLVFVRGLYCVDGSLRPLRGAAADVFGCPTSGNRAAFARAHPGLFASTGYAHHPYLFDQPADQHESDPNKISIADLPTLERTLVRIFGVYGRGRHGGVPLYATEWGYKSDPPNPFSRTKLAQQASWINEGEYLAWREPYVKELNQFELVDSPPRPGFPLNARAAWGSFQTGLMLRNGHAKPSFSAFRLPIWVPVPRHGSSVAVWAQLRPADHATTQSGVIEFKPLGGRRWSTLRKVQTANREGYLVAHVRIPRAGSVRIGWTRPGTRTELDSIAVAVS